MNDFRIIECTSDRIIVSRDPQNQEEIDMMRAAVMDAKIREMISNGDCIKFPDKRRREES